MDSIPSATCHRRCRLAAPIAVSHKQKLPSNLLKKDLQLETLPKPPCKVSGVNAAHRILCPQNCPLHLSRARLPCSGSLHVLEIFFRSNVLLRELRQCQQGQPCSQLSSCGYLLAPCCHTLPCLLKGVRLTSNASLAISQIYWMLQDPYSKWSPTSGLRADCATCTVLGSTHGQICHAGLPGEILSTAAFAQLHGNRP